MRCLPCWSSVLLTAAAALFAAILSSCSGAALGGKPGGSPSGGPPASKVTPTITWPAPSPITNPTPLSTTQLDATASVPGTFVYTPPAGTVLAAGTQTLSVAFTPTDTAAYNTASASVSITVNPAIQTGGSPDAYVYVASSLNNNSVQTYAFSAAADGTLTPLAGSPFATGVALMAANRNYLFGTDGIDIDSFSIASDGTLQQVASINAQQLNGQLSNGTYCGGPQALFLDPTGTTLYANDYHGNICANNAFQFFDPNSSSGQLTYLGVSSAASPEFLGALSFIGNKIDAYGSSCYHYKALIYGFERKSDGTLTSLNMNPAMPAAQSGDFYCPYLAAADTGNDVAIPVQPLDDASWQPVAPYQLAVYTADGSGNLTTTSTYSNMPSISAGFVRAIAMSPAGDLLAVAGTEGLQVFHFNGADPITPYTGLLATDEVDQIFWDNDNHLYAIGQASGKLFVFTLTPTMNSQAPGSPHTIASPTSMVVLAR
jgi:WD40 repeat protein